MLTLAPRSGAMKIQCPSCQTPIEPASLQGAAARIACPGCGAELSLSELVETSAATFGRSGAGGGAEAVPLPGSPQQVVPPAREAAPPPPPTAGWTRQVAAPPQLGFSQSPPVVPAAPSARRTSLKDIVFDDFDLDDEKPAPATDFVLEDPEEFEGSTNGELPELILESWDEPEEGPEEQMPELPSVADTSALHLALEDETPEAPAPAAPQGTEATPGIPAMEKAPPVLQAAPLPKAKGPSLGARLQGLAGSERIQRLHGAVAALPRRQKILAGAGLCLVPLAIGAFLFLGAEDVAPPPAPMPPPAQGAQAPKGPPKDPAASAAAGDPSAKKSKKAERAEADEGAPAKEPETGQAGEAAPEEPAAPTPEALAAQARDLQRKGKAQEALALLEGALEATKEHPELLLAQGEILGAQGDREGALEACGKAASKDPALLGAPLCLSRLHLAMGKEAEALAAVRSALQIDPADEGALLQHGAVLLAGNRLLDAAAVYEGLLGRAELRAETRAEALLRLARLRLALGQPHEVLRLLEGQVSQSAPPDLLEAQADAHAGMQQWSKAEELYRKIAQRPGVPYKLGKIELTRGRVRQAIPFLVRAAAETGTPPEVFRDLGYSYKEVGRRRDAAKAFRDYLAKKADAVDREEIEEEIAQLGRG